MMKKVIYICLALCFLALQNAKAEKKSWRWRFDYDLVDTGLYWELNSGVLTISGIGSMPPTTVGPWDGVGSLGKDAVCRIVIEQGVTNVSAYIFDKHRNLESVILPTSITSIGSHAFSGCENLQSIVIPSSVTTIPKYAFEGCKNLVSVTIPNSVTSIEEGAFISCGLTSVTFPSSIVSIGRSAFSSCQSLESVIIPSSVTSSLDDVFSRENGPILISKTIVIGDKTYFLVSEKNTIPLGGHYARIEKKYGLKNNIGEWTIPLSDTYSEIIHLTGNFIKVKRRNNNLYGLFDVSGREIIPTEMTAIESAGNGYLKYQINGFWGVMNYTGKIIIDTDRGYTSIGDYKSFNKRFAYTMAGYKGECDATGRQISKIKVETPKQNTSVASSSSSSSSSSSTSSSSGNNSSGNNTTTIHVEHHRDPVPVQQWQACFACGGMGTMGCDFCGGGGTKYIGDRLHRCSRCNGRGIIPCNVCYGNKGQYVTVYK